MNTPEKSGRKRGAPLLADTLAGVGDVVNLSGLWPHTGISKTRWYAIARKWKTLRPLDAKRLDRALGKHIRAVTQLRREIRRYSSTEL